MNDIEYFFAEDQGRYIVEINQKDLKEVSKILDKNSVHHEKLGVIVDKDVISSDLSYISDQLAEFSVVKTGYLKVLPQIYASARSVTEPEQNSTAVSSFSDSSPQIVYVETLNLVV